MLCRTTYLNCRSWTCLEYKVFNLFSFALELSIIFDTQVLLSSPFPLTINSNPPALSQFIPSREPPQDHHVFSVVY